MYIINTIIYFLKIFISVKKAILAANKEAIYESEKNAIIREAEKVSFIPFIWLLLLIYLYIIMDLFMCMWV